MIMSYFYQVLSTNFVLVGVATLPSNRRGFTHLQPHEESHPIDVIIHDSIERRRCVVESEIPLGFRTFARSNNHLVMNPELLAGLFVKFSNSRENMKKEVRLHHRPRSS